MRIATTAQEILELRPLWEQLISGSPATVFQEFDLNLLAARMFAGREVPHVVCAINDHGMAIIPAAVRLRDMVISLLGEELFDYRIFLHTGDEEALRAAFAELAKLRMPLDVLAVRGSEAAGLPGLTFTAFAGAPMVRCADTDSDQFTRDHIRLPRNLRRLSALGFTIHRYDGAHPQLLRTIYGMKAEQDPQSLFHDPVRIEFVVKAALLRPELFEIFTLECGTKLGAALVTLCESDVRRFYTGWFDPELAKHSPALSLIHHVTCETLAQGKDCDFLTGEQPYKLRLATSSHQLYRLHATADQLSQIGSPKKVLAQPLVPGKRELVP